MNSHNKQGFCQFAWLLTCEANRLEVRNAVVAGHLTFTSGSGGLAGLHGEGTFTADTYSYN
jgi:hypothetical protein